MTIDVTNAELYKADPVRPSKRRIGSVIACADLAAVHTDRRPNVSQPFRFAKDGTGSPIGTPEDFVVGGPYWMDGWVDGYGKRTWYLELVGVRMGGTDIVLDLDEVTP
jgi:hypothetical protein